MNNHWNGKLWYAYGTSMTSVHKGQYVPVVEKLSGMTVINKGIPGGSLTPDGFGKGNVKRAVMNMDDGKVYRAAMFGGSSANQLKKDYMNRRRVPYLDRGLFYQSVERLLGEHVDVMIGNHTWQNHTAEKYAKMGESEINPFINPKEWGVYLRSLERALTRIMKEESRTRFINYAHRGASEYYPENTFSAFDAGIEMGANGIETDVRRTKDGVLVLFHDSTLERVCGESGCISDYTYEELLRFSVRNGERQDKIVKLEDFLARYGELEIFFAIELKDAGVEREVVDLIKKYSLESKTTVTSFNIDYLRALKEYDPLMHAGYLTRDYDDETIEKMISIGIDEYCPVGREVTAERIEAWHRIGFNVRAWGISSEEIMKQVYDAGADGMTVNYPDKLTAYIAENNESLQEQSN